MEKVDFSKNYLHCLKMENNLHIENNKKILTEILLHTSLCKRCIHKLVSPYNSAEMGIR